MNEYGLTVGTVNHAAAGPMTFGPEGILFLADNASATVFAVDVEDKGHGAGVESFELADVDVRVASLLGCGPADIAIRDMAVHPVSRAIYLSVQRGHGAAGRAVVIRIDPSDGAITDVPLDAVPFAGFRIDDAPAEDDERPNIVMPVGEVGEEIPTPDGHVVRILRLPRRTATITDLAYTDGHVLIAGLSNEEFSSKLRRIRFPFGPDGIDGVNPEIYHVSHGRWETAAPIRTLVPYEGGRSVIAAYTCTPLVHIPLTDLEHGQKVVGRTVADLGNTNQPLDMVTFTRNGIAYLLIANTRYGLLRVACDDVDGQPPLTEPKMPVGIPRTVEQVTGVIRLANLTADAVLALRVADHRWHLVTLKTDSL